MSSAVDDRNLCCHLCRATQFKKLFSKLSEAGSEFDIYRCRRCGLAQLLPQPEQAQLDECYQSDYFARRSERGYDNYRSESLKREIRRVFELNLRDLDFFKYEAQLQELKPSPAALDVGCAAGYFVEYLKDRNWAACGVELGEDIARFGIDELGLDIIIDDFLATERLQPESFDLLSFWASIEHMRDPRAVLQRSYQLLKPGGRMLLSTCRYGLIARYRGAEWRYMNLPEHLFFFSVNGLERLAEECGFRVVKTISYGSGFTSRTNAGPLYRLAKRFADGAVKAFNQGDMMAFQIQRL